MAHFEQQLFCLSVKDSFPDFFKRTTVLDCGSLDINGSNRLLFEDCHYTGIDIGPGKNVDLIYKTHEFNACDELYDTIISTSCFEHDRYWDRSLLNIVRMLKKGGLFFFTCATTGFPEHGTRRTTPSDSPLTISYDDEWADYYKNLTAQDFLSVIPVKKIFSKYQLLINEKSCDLCFWGIKNTH